jgi:hypothetical protein
MQLHNLLLKACDTLLSISCQVSDKFGTCTRRDIC